MAAILHTRRCDPSQLVRSPIRIDERRPISAPIWEKPETHGPRQDAARGQGRMEGGLTRARTMIVSLFDLVMDKTCMTVNEAPWGRIRCMIVGGLLIVLSILGVIGLWGWIGILPLVTGSVAYCPD